MLEFRPSKLPRTAGICDQDNSGWSRPTATIWEAAEALLKTAGSVDVALSTARDFASIGEFGYELAETAYWLSVADAIEWLANPQPLIAPHLQNSCQSTEQSPQASVVVLEMPKHQSNVLRFREKFRDPLQEEQRPQFSNLDSDS